MGRGRVQLKRIENTINRQVTFSKRRAGLLKKAHEISVLCDADVALIVFSPKGRLYEYSTDSSMDRILERYERYSYAEKAVAASDDQPQGNWCDDYGKLKARIESLQKSQRHLMGERLDMLNVKELQQLEQQLENALKHIRSRKNQLLFDSISDLQKKEKELHEHNRNLEKQLMEKEEREKEKTLLQQGSWEQQLQPHTNSTATPFPTQNAALPCLNIRIYSANGSSEEEPAQPTQRVSEGLPAWMMPSVNEKA